MSENSFGHRRNLDTQVLEGYVAVAFAESRREAEKCRALLEENGIPAVVEDVGSRRGRLNGISVLVQDLRLDEASDLLASRDAAPGLNAGKELKDGPTEDDEDVDDFDDEDDDFDDDEEEEEDVEEEEED